MKKKLIDRLFEDHKEWNKVNPLDINEKVAVANSERFWKLLIARKKPKNSDHLVCLCSFHLSCAAGSGRGLQPMVQ